MGQSTGLVPYLENKQSKIALWVPPRWAAAQKREPAEIALTVVRHAGMQLQGQRVDPGSVYVACLAFLQAGIVPNAQLGHGHFVAFKGRVTPIFGYKGLATVARREAQFREVVAQVVVEGDRWREDLPDDEAVRWWRPGQHHHDDAPESEWRYGFAYARWADGFTTTPLVMHAQDLRIRRARAMARGARRDDAPWRSWPLQMARKTVLLRLLRSEQVALSGADYGGYGELSYATSLDDVAETGRPLDVAALVRGRAQEAGVAEEAMDDVANVLDEMPVFDEEAPDLDERLEAY